VRLDGVDSFGHLMFFLLERDSQKISLFYFSGQSGKDVKVITIVPPDC
jgi:hypothetical protein